MIKRIKRNQWSKSQAEIKACFQKWHREPSWFVLNQQGWIVGHDRPFGSFLPLSLDVNESCVWLSLVCWWLVIFSSVAAFRRRFQQPSSCKQTPETQWEFTVYWYHVTVMTWWRETTHFSLFWYQQRWIMSPNRRVRCLLLLLLLMKEDFRGLCVSAASERLFEQISCLKWSENI